MNRQDIEQLISGLEFKIKALDNRIPELKAHLDGGPDHIIGYAVYNMAFAQGEINAFSECIERLSSLLDKEGE